MSARDPRRWLEDEAADAQLRSLLQAGAEDVAPPAVLERSARKLTATLGVQLLNVPDKLGPAQLGAPHGASASGGAQAALGGKLITAAAAKGALALALVGGASWLAVGQLQRATRVHSDARSVATAQNGPRAAHAPGVDTITPASAPQAADQVDAVAIVAAPALARDKMQASQLPTLRVRAAPHAASTELAPVIATPSVDAQRGTVADPEQAQAAVDPGARAAELRSLEDAQRALVTSPSLALRRLREHQREFPNGWLDEERSALEVQALIMLGDRDAAERALEQLATRHPRSLAITRLRNSLK